MRPGSIKIGDFTRFTQRARLVDPIYLRDILKNEDFTGVNA
jgi:hypothetical protein